LPRDPKDLLNTIRGMRDILPDEMALRNKVLGVIRDLFGLYGYREILTPTIEPYELYAAKSGEEIRHRMYTFTDMGGRKVVLRPEATPSISRLVARKFRSESLPIRLGYILSVFRYDEPQRGRYREFMQAGFELFGSKNMEADAEILQISNDLMRRLGFQDYTFKVGNQGLMKALMGFGGMGESAQGIVLHYIDKGQLDEAEGEISRSSSKGNLIAEKVRRLALLSKEAEGEDLLERGAEIVKDVPDAGSAISNLSEVLDLCKGIAVDRLKVDLGFARGLEYYTGTIFEVYVPGVPVAVNGGGRYDGLTGLFGYPLPAVGCAPGVDRIVLAMQEKRASGAERVPMCMVVATSPECIDLAFKAADAIRSSGTSAMLDVNRRNLNSALRYASERGIRYVVIIGTREAKENLVTLRDMMRNVQVQMPMNELPNSISQST